MNYLFIYLFTEERQHNKLCSSKRRGARLAGVAVHRLGSNTPAQWAVMRREGTGPA
jgi:hypothetical protein